MNPHMHPVREAEVVALRAELARVTAERDGYLKLLRLTQPVNDNQGASQ